VKDGFVMLCACLKCCCILIWLKPYSVVTLCDSGKLNYPWIQICTLIHVMLFRVENLFLRIVNFLWVSFCCVCVRVSIYMYVHTYLLIDDTFNLLSCLYMICLCYGISFCRLHLTV
jgi:hypothetical protein